MASRRGRRQTRAEERAPPVDMPPSDGEDEALTDLRVMFRNFMTSQKLQEQRHEHELARQEQRWKSLHHQFVLFQGEVTRDRQERATAGRGLSASAPVSTVTSPSTRQAGQDQVTGLRIPQDQTTVQRAQLAAGGATAAHTAPAPGQATATHGLAPVRGTAAAATNTAPLGLGGSQGMPATASTPGRSVGGGITVPVTHWGAGMHTSGSFQRDMGSPVEEGYPQLLFVSGWRGPRMQKYVQGEDIEHFLIGFERIASASGCPRAEWAMHLVPLLTGKAKAAYIAMDFEETMDYDKVKIAILDKFEINPETYRQRFRSWDVRPDETPKELYVRLKELYEKWVCPRAHSKEEIGELLILEQFLQMVNSEVRLWIRKHNPRTAKEAVSLADAFMLAQRGSRPYKLGPSRPYNAPTPGPSRPYNAPTSGRTEAGQTGREQKWREQKWERPIQTNREEWVCYHCGQAGHIKPNCPLRKPKDGQVCCRPNDGITDCLEEQWESVVEVTIKGEQLKALVDTGSSQTLVGAKWVPGDAIHKEHTVKIRCVHGDVMTYPTADIYMQIGEQEYLVSVGVVEHLPYPVVLGRDLPGLLELVEPVKSCNVAVTRSKAKEMEKDGLWDALPFFEPPSKVPKTRSQRRQDRFRGTKVHETLPAPDPGEHNSFTLPPNVRELQNSDETLKNCFKDLCADSEGNGESAKFRLKQGILYRHADGGEQLVVPKSLRATVLGLGHSVPWSGHLGQNKTWERVARRFYWPNMYTDLIEFCKTCPQCQLVAPGRKGNRVPLIPMPIIEVPFSRIAMDIVGPLERSRRGNRYILVIMDYATKYPEAFPLRHIKARQVANALLQLVTRVGIPQEVLTDQGTNFTSKLLKQVYQYLGIKAIKTTPYHPQTDGLVERFNQTLKNMLRKFVADSGADWDEWLPYLLFAYREVPQASTGFSPFELLYGRQVRGPLDILKEAWEGQQPQQGMNILSYVLKMRNKMESLAEQVQENMRTAQAVQKRWYDQTARERTFKPGQQVLLLLPTAESSLLAKWQGPFTVERKVGTVTYEILMPGRRKGKQIFHVNMLKEWRPREAAVAHHLLARRVDEEEEQDEQFFPVEQGHEVRSDLSHLSPGCQQELEACIPEGLFTETPGRTPLVEHHIRLKAPGPVRLPGYRIPAQLLPKIRQEVETMLEMGIIEPSHSEWSCPIVLVPKKDGTMRFCMDFRKLNSISAFDPYPMPRVDELIDRLGCAKYLTTLDLSKGYWQVPLAADTKELTAFRTPFGFYQYTMMPFGLQGAPATFQRLMDKVLEGAREYASAYLDDVVVFSHTWEDHLTHVQEVLRRIQAAGLTVNPKKCALAQAEVKYLGYVIGGGTVKPQLSKVSAILETPRPTTKKQVRSFLGVVGWYRRFVENFSNRAAPLIELTRKSSPNQVVWSEDCDKAFNDLRSCLCSDPILQNPDFSQPFTVQTDASGVGLGAVLLQGEVGEQKPVVYLSRKLFPRELRYSTVEKECLALKWAVDSLKYYLMGKDFILETDHRALKWLHRMKDTNSRVTRWYLALQPFNFEVRYRAGPENTTADYLSRVFEDENP